VARKPADQNHDTEAGSNRALMKRAAALLARRSYSRGELRGKLLPMADAGQVETTLDRLEQLNLLNDAEYAYNFALYRIGREIWGAAKVTAALRRRYVEPEIIEDALRRVQSELGSETVPVEYMQKFCGEHWPPTDPAHIRKLIMHLRRRGFGETTIERALKRILPPSAYRRFEFGE
jgi:SOS response regulatory protein OraA/RecX